MGNEIDMLIAWLLGKGPEPSEEDKTRAAYMIVALREENQDLIGKNGALARQVAEESKKPDTVILKDPAVDWVRVVSSSEHVVEIYDGDRWLTVGATDLYEKAESIAEGLRQCVRGACAAACERCNGPHGSSGEKA